jgi:hypothetical protein
MIDNAVSLAHRVSWSISNGPIPVEMCVLHRCDNPSCVNPEHLFLGTQKDNIADMVEKGRNKSPGVKGQSHHSAKLNNAGVHKIRERLAAGITQRAVAKEFKMSPGAINRISRGFAWAHI